MDRNVSNRVVVPIAVAAPSPATPGGDFQQGRAAEQAVRAAQYRLVIEEGPTRGTFVYKTLDSETGKVVRQFPREEVLKMSESGGYSAGGLIDTSA
jgi:flagellar protein FlaG